VMFAQKQIDVLTNDWTQHDRLLELKEYGFGQQFHNNICSSDVGRITETVFFITYHVATDKEFHGMNDETELLAALTEELDVYYNPNIFVTRSS